MEKGSYTVTFYNQAGTPVYSKKIEHAGYTAAQLITLPQNLAAGSYFAVLNNDKVQQWTQQIIVQ